MSRVAQGTARRREEHPPCGRQGAGPVTAPGGRVTGDALQSRDRVSSVSRSGFDSGCLRREPSTKHFEICTGKGRGYFLH